MPIYEYECSECRERHEIIQKLSDEPLTHCPKCSGSMRKLISSPAIQFKGSGFYKTDYASSASGSGKSAGSGDSAPAETKSEKKTESTSESKSSSNGSSTGS